MQMLCHSCREYQMEVMVGAFGVARQEAIAAAEQLQSVLINCAPNVTIDVRPGCNKLPSRGIRRSLITV